MRSSVINTTLLDKREYILMKNRREELDIIPNDYILEYYPKKDDVSTLTLEIPSHLRRGDIIVEYPLYENMQPRRHIVVKSDDQPIERYVVEDIDIVDEGDYKTKKVTAYGYDYTLKTKTCLINEGLTRQLYCPADEKVHVGEGILNMFENQTGWKVNHVDDMARSEMVTENVSVIKTILGEKTYETVEDNKVLFELNVDIPAEENFPLNFDIAWVDLVVTTTDGFTYDSGSIIHTFTDLSQGVKSVKATFTSNSTQRYGITYELTLDNDETETHTYAFANCRNLKLATKGVNLTYQTSQEEEKLVVKYRYLEYGQSYWYQYLKTTVQEAFNVYITFNSYDKTINVYSQEQFGKWKGFYLDYNNLLTKVNKQPDMGELCTRLWVQSNNVDITEVNPLGTSYLEDYSYFEQSGTMSISLSEALKRYYAHVEVQQVKWLEVSKLKNSTDQWLTKRNSELVKLNEQVKAKQALLTAYLKADNNEEGQERVAQELKELEAQVSEKLKQIEDLKEQSDNYLSQMQLIGKEMAKESCVDSQGKIFTKEDIEELDDLTIEQTYTDEYYTKAKGLFDHAKTIMKDKATLKYTFSLEHKDFAQNIKHPLGWEWFVEIGAKVEIPDKDIADADGFITIYAYKYSPKNKTMESVEFDNNSAVIKAVSGLASFSKIAYNTATMTDFWKETWKEAENATAIVKDIRKNGLDLAANMVRGGNTVNKISMTESGLFIIDAENEDNQIYVGSSLIAITDDRWITSKTAINTGGVIADTIVGRLLLGEQLFISNEDGSFSILPNGLSIKDSIQEEVIGLGISEKGNSYFHLGTKEDSAYLIFDENGHLDIKASSVNLSTGSIPSKDEVEDIINGQIGQIELGGRNYALDTKKEKVIEGNGATEQVVSLYDLSLPGSYFFGKNVSLTFEWSSTGTKGSFYVRNGSPHKQIISEEIAISSTNKSGKARKTVKIESGSSYSNIELVGKNLDGKLTISKLKYEQSTIATDWTPAPEDSTSAFNIVLTNEAQVIPTTTDLKPLKDETYKTEVMVYRGSKLATDFKIKDIQSADGITVTKEGNTVYFAVDDATTLAKASGSFDIIVELEDGTLKKSWTWSVAKQGADGIIGESAKLITISGEQVFKYRNGLSNTPENQTITLSATLFNTDGCQWSYRAGEGATTDIQGETQTDLVVRHDGNYWGNNTQLIFRCTTKDKIYDEITISKIADGIDGESSYTVFLTNEAHVIPCDYDGRVDRVQKVTTNVVVYKGTEKVQPTLGTINAVSGMEVSIGQAISKEIPIAFTIKEGNDLAENGSIEIPVVLEGQTFTKLFTWSKSRDGQNGTDAQYVIITGEQVFKYADGFGGTPTPATIQLVATKNNIATDGKWQWKNGENWTDLGVTDETITITPTTGGLATAKNCTFRYIVGNLYDAMSIIKVADGQDGADGTPAQYVILTGEQVFRYDQGFDETPTPQSITLTATPHNFTSPKYKWQVKRPEDTTWTTITSATTKDFTIKHNDTNVFISNSKASVVRCVVNDTAYDEMSIVKISNGINGKNVIEIKEQYYLSTSQQTLAGGSWVVQAPTWEQGKFIWTRTTFVYSDGSTMETTPICVTGRDGEDGLNGGISVTRVDVFYYKSTSPTQLIGGEWTTNAPTWEQGKYIWSKTITYMDDGNQNETPPVCLSGEKGDTGEDAYTIILSNESHSFPCNHDGVIESEITTSTKVVAFQGSREVTPTIGTLPQVQGLTLSKTGATVNIVAQKGSALASVGSFNIPITVNSKSYTKTFSWTKSRAGATGESGADGYTIVLTNENHTFPCEADGSIKEEVSTETDIKAFKGSKEIAPTIGTLPTVAGLTLSKQGTKVIIKALVGSSLGETGSFTIPVVVDGQTINKVFSWTKSKRGESGESAKTVDIVASTQVFKSIDAGKTYTPDTITLTPIMQNVSLEKWQYSLNSTTWTDVVTGKNGISLVGDNLIITNSSTLFTQDQLSVTFKAITDVEGIVDTYTVLKIIDTSSVVNEIQGQIEDIESELNNLSGTLDKILQDGIITDAELKIIENNLVQLDKEKAEVMALYEKLYNNTYLR